VSAFFDPKPQIGSDYFRANVLNHAGDVPNFDYLSEASPQFAARQQARPADNTTAGGAVGVAENNLRPSDNLSDAGQIASNQKGDRIQWYNDFADAFTAGIVQHKPIVMLFEDHGPNTDAIEQQLASADVQRFGSQAIFGRGHIDKDAAALAMAQNLDLTRLPTISVFAPNSKQISELGRLEGYHTSAQIAEALDIYIHRVNDVTAPTSPPTA